MVIFEYAPAIHLAFVADKEIVKEHAQLREPGMRAHWDAATAPPWAGVGAATSAWAADQRNEALGRISAMRRGCR